MLKAVRELRETFGWDFALNAVGGIFTGRDAFEALALGADTVQIYTALVYRGPYAVRRILEELVLELRSRGLSTVADLRSWRG
jgi:dihydroorotate dehydrogenase